MKIRDIIIGLTGTLSLLLLLATSSIVMERWRDYDAARRLELSNQVREQLLLLEQALLNERSQTLQIVAMGGEWDELRSAREMSNQAVNRVTLEASNLRELLQAGRMATALSAVKNSIDTARQRLDSSLEREQTADGLAIQNLINLVGGNLESLRELRLLLVRDERASGAGSQPNALLRYYTSLFVDAVSKIEIEKTRWQGPSEAFEIQSVITAHAAEAALALQLMTTQAAQTATPVIEDQLKLIAEIFDEAGGLSQLPMLQRDPIRDQGSTEILRGIVAESQHLQSLLLDQARTYTKAERQAAFQTIVLWLLILGVGIIVFAASILLVRWRIVMPLERLADAMEQLADDQIDTHIPRLQRNDEIGAMNAAVRKFKANAIKRVRLQQNRDNLHARLKQTYRQLRGDLEAAAKVQHAVLPDSSRVGSLQFNALFKPSALIAGDSYNVVKAHDDRVRFFLIDVAGHGAQAALVSMTAHALLTEALMAKSDRPLTEILANLNSNWPKDLPYLTLILGDYLPNEHRFELVQAGHPSPLLISKDGNVQPLGTGGTPIGLVDSVEHDILVVEAERGNRLLIHSDGLIEAENLDGEAFGEQRLFELVRRHCQLSSAEFVDVLETALRSWRGKPSLDDDVTLLLIEPAGDYI